MPSDSTWGKRIAYVHLVIVAALVGADLGGVVRRLIPPFSAALPPPVASMPASRPVAVPQRAAIPASSRWHPVGDTKFVPELRDGRPVGLRLSGVGSDGLFAKLGLRDGDRLDSVGGHRVTSPREMIALYTRLRTLDVLKLLIERDGQPLTITINLR